MAETSRSRIGQPSLVGRDDECVLLAEVLDESRAGRGAVILMEGPAGIGKSRLAREAVAMAEARGFMTLVGVCSQEERGTAYTPIIDAMRDIRMRDSGARRTATRRLHDLLLGLPDGAGEQAPAMVRQINSAQVTEAVLRFLDEAPDGAGSLVVVEDVHWADHATMRLLTDVSRHARDRRIALALTYRDDEVVGNDALGRLLHTLGASNLNLHTLRLRTLTWSETRAMAQLVLGIDWMPPTAFVDHLFGRAEGNPFFTEEILRAVPTEAPVDRLSLRIPDELPVSVARLLEQRLRRLPEEVVRTLATAAVLGRRFDQSTLVSIGVLSKRAVVAALHDAIDAHLLRDTGDGRTFEFQHALIREAAESMLLSSERRELHQRIAEELEAREVSESAAIAYHYAQAGMRERLISHAVAAADDAWRAGAPVESARWYEQALDAAEAGGDDVPEPVLRRAADAFAAARQPKRATETFERLIRQQHARGDVVAEAETVAEFASMFPADLVRWTDLLQYALQILEPLGETAALARVYGRLASVYVVTSQAREAIEAGRLARDIAKRTGAIDAEAVGRRALGTIVAAGGDLPAGRRFLERSIELAKSVNKHTDVYLSSLSLLDSAIRASDWELAEATARASIGYARKLGSGLEAGALMARFADLLRFTGRIEEAGVMVDDALLLLDQDEVYIFIGALQVKASVLADLGRWREVRELLEPMLPAAERSAQFHIHGGALFLLALAAYGDGRVSEAHELVGRSLAEWRETQDNYYCLPMLVFACRLACEAGDLAAAGALVVELQGVFARTPLCSAAIPAAEAWRAVAEGRLQEAIGLWAESAEAYAQLGRVVDASRSRLELARTLLAHAGPGCRNRAREELVMVRTSVATLPEAAEADALLRRHRLIVKRNADGEGGLTAREREIVALIVRGMTNRRIASELTLSARTVDNHVSRILGKLRLSSRSQIVAFALDPGTAPSPHDK